MADARVSKLTDAQLVEALRLAAKSDTVELKLTVPDADRRSAVAALGLDVLDAQIRQVMFFDTPELTLNASGLVVRARRIQGQPGDTVVKLRPVVPDELAADERALGGFGVEIDAMPGGFVCSARLKAEVDPVRAKETFLGERPIWKLLTKPQRAFFAAHAPDGFEPERLARLGPINVLKLKFFPRELGLKMVAELWFYPDGSRILELSTKSAPGEALETAVMTRAYLANRGIDLEGEQQTKTKTALEFFANELTTA